MGPDSQELLGSNISTGSTRVQRTAFVRGLLNRARAVTAISDGALAWVTRGPDSALASRHHESVRMAHPHLFQQVWAACDQASQPVSPQTL